MRVELSEAADADLADLLEYGISNFGLVAGREYCFSFDTAFAFLRETPEAGQID
jgi:plasmid stabilization system protein ParE